MMVGALTSIQKTGLFRRITTDQQIAFLLGQQLLAEIQCQDYVDPANPYSVTLGPESGEIVSGKRSLYDDVDDYNGWIEQPPKLPNGTELANRSQWYRTVKVEFVQQSNLELPVAYDYGLKRITVEVGTVAVGGSAYNTGDRKPLATLVAIAGRGRMQLNQLAQ